MDLPYLIPISNLYNEITLKDLLESAVGFFITIPDLASFGVYAK